VGTRHQRSTPDEAGRNDTRKKLIDITGLPLKSIEQRGKVIGIGALVLNSAA
jgi:CO/xanthine dehydrogenase FAD-binding subunit